MWDPLRPVLTASGLRPVAYDLRGHGDSPGPTTSLRAHAGDVQAMIDGERAPVVVVGASLGGFAALGALAAGPTASRVVGLVLVDVVPDPEPGPVRRWLGQQGLLRDQAVRVLVDDILEQGPQLLATAAGLDMPILLVRGGRSPLDDGGVDRLRAANARVTVATVATAGHLVARDAPTQLAGIVADRAARWFAALP